MKSIIIDDNVEFAKLLAKQLGNGSRALVEHSDSIPLTELEVLQKLDKLLPPSESDEISIIININIKLKASYRQTQEGVNITQAILSKPSLKEIRIMFFSFLDRDKLVDLIPDNVALHSLPFRQLPWKPMDTRGRDRS